MNKAPLILACLVFPFSASATNFYVGQASAGAADGTSQGNRWSYATLAGLNWATTFGDNDTLCIVGTVTSAFVAKTHSSATMLTISGGCDSTTNLGNLMISGASAAFTLGGTGQEHTTLRDITVRSTGGTGIRLNGDVVAIDDVHILNVISNNNGALGLSLKCTTVAATYNNITIANSSFDNNASQGFACRVDSLGTGVFVDINNLDIQDSHFNSNGNEGVALYDTTGSAQVTNTCNIRIDGFLNHRNEANNNGLHGWRIGNGGHCHNNGAANFDYVTANNNGVGANGGGILFDGFGVAGRTRAQVLAAAFDGAAGANSGCYYGHITTNGNAGMNSGNNLFALNGCLVEHVQSIGNTVEGDSTIIDGNGIIFDEETDNTVGQFIETSGNYGNPNVTGVNASGAGIMVLRQVNDLTIRYAWGTDNKTCLWITGPNTTGVDVYNLTFTGCRLAGIRHTNTITTPSEYAIRNSIFTCSSAGTTIGYDNDENSNTVANHNIFHGCDTAYDGQTAGTGDSTAAPLLVGGREGSTYDYAIYYIARGDYKISSTSSPAYNGGTSQSYTNVDADGVIVPKYTTVDIGAYEFARQSCRAP